jgi:hypothetical protein
MRVKQRGIRVIRVNRRCYRRCEAIQLGRLTAANTLDSKVTETVLFNCSCLNVLNLMILWGNNV